MDAKTAGELIQELVDIHCRTLIRFQRRQELLQEQDEDDSKFSDAASLLKPLLANLVGPVHYQRGWEGHYAIRLDSDTELVLVESMLDLPELDLVDDRLISDDCLATIEKELIELSKDNGHTDTPVLNHDRQDKGRENRWEPRSNDGQ